MSPEVIQLHARRRMMKLFRSLAESPPGLTRTEVCQVFHNREYADQAIRDLRSRDLVDSQVCGIRNPTTIYFITPAVREKWSQPDITNRKAVAA